jgi:hypothetical protein
MTPRVRQYVREAASNHGIGVRAVLERTHLPASNAARAEVILRLHGDGFKSTQIGPWVQRDSSTVRSLLRRRRVG